MNRFMDFVEEAIDTAREVGVEKREQARTAEMRAIERQQRGATKRTQMRTQAQRDVAEIRGGAVAQRDSVKKDSTGKGITKSQIAKFRTDALSGAQKQLEGLRDMSGNIIDPATGQAMTSAREQEYAKVLADDMMSYSLREQSGATEQPQASGRVTTEGGRMFKITPGTERGYTETTPMSINERNLMIPQVPGIKPLPTAPNIAVPQIPAVQDTMSQPSRTLTPPIAQRPTGPMTPVTEEALRARRSRRYQTFKSGVAGLVGGARKRMSTAQQALFQKPTLGQKGFN